MRQLYMAKKKDSLETDEQKINRINSKLEREEAKQQQDTKGLTSTLLVQIKNGSITIEELAEFAARQAVESDCRAKRKIDEFSTEWHLIHKGVENLESLRNPAAHLVRLHTVNQKKNKGMRKKSIALKSIKVLWQAAIESGDVTKGNKSKSNWIEEILKRPEFEKLNFSYENLKKELTFN